MSLSRQFSLSILSSRSINLSILKNTLIFFIVDISIYDSLTIVVTSSRFYSTYVYRTSEHLFIFKCPLSISIFLPTKSLNNEPSMVDQNPFMVIIVVIINMIMVIISLWTCQLKPFFSKSIEKKYAFMYIVYNWSIHKKWMYNIIICIKGLLTKKIFIIYHTWYIT